VFKEGRRATLYVFRYKKVHETTLHTFGLPMPMNWLSMRRVLKPNNQNSQSEARELGADTSGEFYYSPAR
jgi:hypothetical protein